jgi:hypothetical protein
MTCGLTLGRRVVTGYTSHLPTIDASPSESPVLRQPVVEYFAKESAVVA